MERTKKITMFLIQLKLKVKVLYFLLFVFAVFFAYLAIAPVYKMHEFKNLANSDTLFVENFDSVYYHPEITTLLKEKAFKEALLKLAESDSIQMIINMVDSTVNLSIKGVVIHQTKVYSFENDKLFKKMPEIQKVLLISKPLAILSQFATIIKEPVIERQAPKDTAEAALNAWKPDTLIQNPGFLIFTVEHSIHIIFEQDKNLTSSDKWQRFKFYKRLLIQKATASIANFVSLKKPDYNPTIIIKMPVDDLRAIYRALPKNTFVALNL